MFKKWFLVPAIISCLTAPLAVARNLFLSPNETSSTAIATYTVDPLSFANSIVGPAGTFRVISAGSPTKLYALSRTTGEAITVLEGTFPALQATKRFPLTQPAVAAAVSRDGRRVVVVGGGMLIIDTTTDTAIAQSQSFNVGLNPLSVAISADSTRAYVLSSDSQRLTAINLTNNTVIGPLSIPGRSTSVTLAPNGNIYVGAINAIYEIDEPTLTIRQTIPLNGLPGEPAYTADAKLAVFPNSTSVTGASAFLVDLARRTAVNIPFGGVTFDKIVVADNNSAYAVSSSQGKVYFVNLVNPSAPTPVNISGVTLDGARDIAVSNEAPSARHLFVSGTSSISRVDLRTNTGVSSSATFSGNVSFAGPAATGVPTNFIQINNNQTLAIPSQSLPLIVRATDANGTPLSGVPVTFSTASTGITLNTPTVTTDIEGYAQTLVVVPNTAPLGAVIVNAALGTSGLNAQFTVTLGTGTGGGPGPGPGPATGGIRVLEGQGQVLSENFSTISQEPIVLEVFDAQNKPVAGATVTYALTSGSVSINPQSGTTDANGRTTVNVTANTVSLGQRYVSSSISATTGSDSTTIYVTTVEKQISGQPGFGQATLIRPVDRVIKAKAGETLSAGLQYDIFSSSGAKLPNVGLRIINTGTAATGPTANCANSALSDANGTLICDVLAGGKVGQSQVEISVGGFRKDLMVLEVAVGDPAIVRITGGNGQTGTGGQTLPQALLVNVTDAGGNPIAGAPVTFEVVVAATATLSQVSSRTDSNGSASALVTLGQVSGPVQVRVKSGTGTATFSLTATSTASQIAKTGGDNQTAVLNSSFSQPLSVLVSSANGPVSGAAVNFTIVNGSGTLSATTATTNASGTASVTASAGNVAGPIVVQAGVGTITTTFNLTARTPGPAITPASFLNAAGYQPGISPGTIAVIQAPGVAPSLRGSVTPPTLVGPLPMTLNGVSVSFNGVQAPIYSVSNIDGQESVIVQVPFETAPGSATVIVQSAGGGSTTVPGVQILPVKPGIFEYADTNGRRYGVAVRPDGSYVSSTNPARRGEIVRVFATGLGQTSPTAGTNRAGLLNQTVVATVIGGINNSGARVASAKLAEGTVGVYIVELEIPSDSTIGPAINLALAVVGADGVNVFGNGSSLPIGPIQ